jgi:hypothetical protein
VCLLLRKGADPKVLNGQGMTPLRMSVQNGHLGIAKVRDEEPSLSLSLCLCLCVFLSVFFSVHFSLLYVSLCLSVVMTPLRMSVQDGHIGIAKVRPRLSLSVPLSLCVSLCISLCFSLWS